ncbi:MAG: RND transporter [Rhodobacteraceae bacterium]|nr:RND transporter [Paracoccaceae bacterium]
MKLFNKLLDLLPMHTLIVMTIFLGLAPYIPFFVESPHLFAKLEMLGNGTLGKPVDIFDLLMHATPAVLLIAKVIRNRRLKNGS